MTMLYTVGYEGLSAPAFLELLTERRITVLVDVRAKPLSRKPGFSKSTLAREVETAGIKYVHLVALGNTTAGRDAARDGHYAKFRRIYTGYLSRSSAAQGALAALGELIARGTCCLLCFERDPATCHRSIVAQRLDLTGLTITHLRANDQQRHVHSVRASSRLGEGAAAT